MTLPDGNDSPNTVSAKENGGGSSAPATSSAAVSSDQGDAPPAYAARNAAPDAAPAAAKIGQKVREGQFEFTVTKVQSGVKTGGDEYFKEKAKGQFVLVTVTVSNISDSPQTLSHAKGRESSSDTGAAIYLKDNKVFLEEINPGNSVKGTLVFDMPKGTVAASIELHDSPFSGGVTVQLG